MAKQKPVRVYMLYSPNDDQWFQTKPFGFAGWTRDQQVADVWTVKKTAEEKLSSMLGTRAKQVVIKVFVLIPSIG